MRLGPRCAVFNAFYERLGDPVDHSVSDRCDVLGLSEVRGCRVERLKPEPPPPESRPARESRKVLKNVKRIRRLHNHPRTGFPFPRRRPRRAHQGGGAISLDCIPHPRRTLRLRGTRRRSGAHCDAGNPCGVREACVTRLSARRWYGSWRAAGATRGGRKEERAQSR